MPQLQAPLSYPAAVDFALYFLNGMCNTPNNIVLESSGLEGHCIQVAGLPSSPVSIASASVMISCDSARGSTLYADNSCQVPVSDVTALSGTYGCQSLGTSVSSVPQLNLWINCTLSVTPSPTAPTLASTTSAPASTSAPALAPTLPPSISGGAVVGQSYFDTSCQNFIGVLYSYDSAPNALSCGTTPCMNSAAMQGAFVGESFCQQVLLYFQLLVEKEEKVAIGCCC